MKALKVLFAVVALIVSNSAFAQFSNTGTNNGNRSTSSNNRNNYSTNGSTYKGFVEGGYTFGSWGHGSVMTSHGCQINKHVFVGGGTGAKFIDGQVFVPVYGDFRVNFLKSDITPFFGTKVGYSIHSAGGFMFEPAVGVRFGFTDSFAMNFSVGYELQRAKVTHYYYDYYNVYYKTEKENVGGFMLKLGFEF